MTDFPSRIMADRLGQLQHLRSFDYADAYHVAFGGVGELRPAASRTDAEYLHGCCLAYGVWAEQMRVLVELRKPVAA